jgi:hypothetical protein
MKRSRIFAAVASASIAFSATEAAAQKAMPRGACQSLSVKALGSGKAPSRSRTPLTFSAAEVLDLEFQVVVPTGSSFTGRSVELKLFTPKGHLYQTLAVTAAAQGSGASETPKRKARHQTLTGRLPVAGTTIVNNSLYGTWKAEAYLEGESDTCAKPRSFVIQP